MFDCPYTLSTIIGIKYNDHSIEESLSTDLRFVMCDIQAITLNLADPLPSAITDVFSLTTELIEIEGPEPVVTYVDYKGYNVLGTGYCVDDY